jgi:hypothetical protein
MKKPLILFFVHYELNQLFGIKRSVTYTFILVSALSYNDIMNVRHKFSQPLIAQ